MLKKEVERDVDRMEAEAKEGNFSPQELCEKFKEMNEGRLYVNAGNFVMEPKFKQMKELVDPDERLSTKLSGRSERMVDPDKSGRSKYPQVY